MNDRLYFWDTEECALSGDVSVELCHPQIREKLYTFDAPWEGNCVGYFNIVKWQDTYYLYYGANSYPPYECEHTMHPIAFCLLESTDGIHFRPPKLPGCDFFGNRDNNIVWIGTPTTDNFTVMVDENPDCPPEERFKAVSGGTAKNENGRSYGTLDLYVSPDGHSFSFSRRLAVSGNFDSQNTLIYDKNKKTYALYSRKMSGSPDNPVWGGIRTVRVCYSNDLVTFTEPKTIEYGDTNEFEMYTNGIRPYGDIYVGTPTRYIDRADEPAGVEALPDHVNRKYMINRWGRTGTALTDSLFMFSRDGERFVRFPEAFMTPGPEAARNWYYGDCYLSHGHAVTKSAHDGADDEISMFFSRNYRSDKPCELWRCTVRQDGFACIRAKFGGGTVTTRPAVVHGDTLSLNFSSSASGYLTLSILSGEEELFRSSKIFGDSVSRAVVIPQAVREKIAGKEVQIRIFLCDAAIYSIKY